MVCKQCKQFCLHLNSFYDANRVANYLLITCLSYLSPLLIYLVAGEGIEHLLFLGYEPSLLTRRVPCDMVTTTGFEPANVGLKTRCLSPLGYVAITLLPQRTDKPTVHHSYIVAIYTRYVSLFYNLYGLRVGSLPSLARLCIS